MNKKSSLTKKIVIGGFIVTTALGALLIAYWYLAGDPPPIIVKTGSSRYNLEEALVFQSKQPMKQTVLNGYNYNVDNFGTGIKSVKIKDLTGTLEDKDFNDKGGKIEIDIIILQEKVDGDWVKVDTLRIAVAGQSSQNDFAIQTQLDLDQKNDVPPRYASKWAKNGDYKFGEITVRINGVGQPPYTPVGEYHAICISDIIPINTGNCK